MADLLAALSRLSRQQPSLRASDLQKHGIPRTYLPIAIRRGLIRQVSRGVYMSASAAVTASNSLFIACERVPSGVVCLTSALQFHELTTQLPREVWMAIPTGAWKPTLSDPPACFVRMSKPTHAYGVHATTVDGYPVRVYSPAKTVADCFKFRNKIGTDVALEALRDCWRQRRATMDDLWAAATVCRVANVMRPYMESLA